MRHRIETRKLGRSSSHRDAMLRNMVTSLIDKGRITTTLEKAKELRRVADRMVTLGKQGDLAARRRAAPDDPQRRGAEEALQRGGALEPGPARAATPGSCSSGPRPGDNATKAIIEFVDRPEGGRRGDARRRRRGAKAKAGPQGGQGGAKAAAKKAEQGREEGARRPRRPPKAAPQKRGHGKAPASGS